MAIDYGACPVSMHTLKPLPRWLRGQIIRAAFARLEREQAGDVPPEHLRDRAAERLAKNCFSDACSWESDGTVRSRVFAFKTPTRLEGRSFWPGDLAEPLERALQRRVRAGTVSVTPVPGAPAKICVWLSD